MRKRSKIILIIVVVLLIVLGALFYKLVFIDWFLESKYRGNDYSVWYVNHWYDALTPFIYEVSSIDCSVPIDKEDEQKIYIGNSISQSDYCIAINAIRNADPSQCEGMEELTGQCKIIARWNDIGSCQHAYTAGSERNYCLHNAIMSAYSRGRQGSDVWQWCMKIEPYPKDSRYPDFNEQVYCLIGAAYHEQDKDICEQLPDKTDQKVCKKEVGQLMR